MVFAGQDAWRKHPLIYGCYKKPFPGLGVAVGIFGIYLAMDTAFKMTSGQCNCKAPTTVNITYHESGPEGDAPPTATFSNKH